MRLRMETEAFFLLSLFSVSFCLFAFATRVTGRTWCLRNDCIGASGHYFFIYFSYL